MLKVRTIIPVLFLVVVFSGLPGLIQAANSSQPPVASFVYSPEIPTPQESIMFDASTSYAASGWIVQYAWDFGDGGSIIAAEPLTTHFYLVDGDYTVQLTVTDNNGYSNSAVAVVQVRCVVFFRVTILGQPSMPVGNVKVTTYYNNGSAWVKIPPGCNMFEIRYDNMTQPNLAQTSGQKYRNPGYTATILRAAASNIGFDIHSSEQKVFFKIEWGSYVAYWPNETTRVYSYKPGGSVETHDYNPGHQAHWDPTAQTYVIKASHIKGDGVNPTENHPIIVGLSCPPPTQNYYLTVRTAPSGITTIPGQGSYISGTNVTLTAPAYVNVSANTRYRFDYWDVDGTSRGSGVNPITVFMNANHTSTAHYVQQYLITFGHTGLTSDATGTIVTVNAVPNIFTQLPYSLWVDSGSSVTYSYTSTVLSSIPGKQFNLSSVSGPSSPIIVSGPTTITGNYVTDYAIEDKYQITFDQLGIGGDYAGTVVIIDGENYGISQLPVSFWWDANSTHNFAYQSPLIVSSNVKQYVWVSTTGLSSSQGGSLTITTPGNVIGNYKTQCYLNLETNPPAITIPSGSGWYDSGTNATIDTAAFIDIVPGSSRYRFNGWTTVNMAEIQDPARSPASVVMDEGKTVTANYAVQYKITFNQAGVATDFTGTILTLDGFDFNGSSLPVSYMLDKDSVHTFSYSSPLVVSQSKQYAWSFTSGLSTLQVGSITVSTAGDVTGHYSEKIMYTLTVTATSGGITNPPSGAHIYESGSTVQVTAIPDPGFQLDHWELDSNSVGANNPYSVLMNQNHSLKVYFKPVTSEMSVSINPVSGSLNIGESLTFNSIVSGGVPPYSYQWCLDGTPVTGATSNSWTYTPQHASIHHVCLKVTDSDNTTKQSNMATIIVNATPIGGYSVSTAKPNVLFGAIIYIAIVALSSVVLSSKKRKRK